MICPDCHAEYRSGFETCSDCGTPLVHDVVDSVDEAEPQPDWVPLFSITAETEARLIQGFLESEGIPCSLESLVFRAEPFTFGPLAKVRLHVLRPDRERAAELLQERGVPAPSPATD